MNDQSNLTVNGETQPLVAQPQNHSNQPAAQPLPEALQPGGRLDQLLEAGMQWAYAPSHRDLITLLQAIEANLRYERNGPQTEMDPVFGFVVAGLKNNEQQLTFWHDQAITAYRPKRKDYDSLFAELIPQAFRDEVDHVEQYDAFVAGTNPTAGDDFKIYMERLHARRRGSMSGVSTGLASLDRILGGGLRGINFLGGCPGVGKTTLALDIMCRSLDADPKLATLMYSMDMPKDFIYDRLLCREAGVDYAELMSGGDATDAVGAKLDAAGQRIGKLMRRIRVVDEPLMSEQFVPLASELLTAARASRFLVIVDYLQLVPVKKGLVGEEADRYRLRKLQHLQARTRYPGYPLGGSFLVISELRKADFSSEELLMEDLLGSARLAYGADTILLLHGSAAADHSIDAVQVSLKLAKGRDGTTRTTIPLVFEHRVCRFREPTANGSVDNPSSRPSVAARPKVNPMAGKVLGENGR
jgi:hypothetical protein